MGTAVEMALVTALVMVVLDPTMAQVTGLAIVRI
jgi:hypothetical protein